MPEIIRFENVSKRFILRHEKTRSFQEALVNLIRSTGEAEEFWALQDVSFSIQRGESVALVGQNGSGKSTALKMVSHILRPTSGKVIVHGRVNALLELGSGFHPDLTGKENVYLNGSILGLTRRQIDERFDEIVEFSELERFIDTPIKHYSSGMYMRLGFAVAVMTTPDVLVIDEVLAVGDDAFRKKCLGKINQLRDDGATILLVSHAAPVVQQICERAILLHDGQLVMAGCVSDVMPEYDAILNDNYGRRLREKGAAKPETGVVPAVKPAADSPNSEPENSVGEELTDECPMGTGEVRLKDAVIRDLGGIERSIFSSGEGMSVEFRFECDGLVEPANFVSYIYAEDGTLCHFSGTKGQGLVLDWLPSEGSLQIRYENLVLGQGVFHIGLQVTRCNPDMPLYCISERVTSFEVVGGVCSGGGLVNLGNRWAIDGNTKISSTGSGSGFSIITGRPAEALGS